MDIRIIRHGKGVQSQHGLVWGGEARPQARTTTGSQVYTVEVAEQALADPCGLRGRAMRPYRPRSGWWKDSSWVLVWGQGVFALGQAAWASRAEVC